MFFRFALFFFFACVFLCTDGRLARTGGVTERAHVSLKRPANARIPRDLMLRLSFVSESLDRSSAHWMSASRDITPLLVRLRNSARVLRSELPGPVVVSFLSWFLPGPVLRSAPGSLASLVS